MQPTRQELRPVARDVALAALQRLQMHGLHARRSAWRGANVDPFVAEAVQGQQPVRRREALARLRREGGGEEEERGAAGLLVALQHAAQLPLARLRVKVVHVDEDARPQADTQGRRGCAVA